MFENFDSVLSHTKPEGSWWWRSHTSEGLWFHGFGNSWITPENVNSALEIRLGGSTGLVYGAHILDGEGKKYAGYTKLCTDGVSVGVKAPLPDDQGTIRASVNYKSGVEFNPLKVFNISMTYKVDQE